MLKLIDLSLALFRQSDKHRSIPTILTLGYTVPLRPSPPPFEKHDTEVHETDHRQPFGDNTSVDGRYILELTFSPSMTAPDLTHATVDDYAMMLTSSHDGKVGRSNSNGNLVPKTSGQR